MSRVVGIAGVFAAVLFAAGPAQASSIESQLQELGHNVGSFLGLGHRQADKPAESVAAPAAAERARTVGQIGHDLVSFFGFGRKRADTAPEAEPAVVVPPQPELKARAIEPETVIADVAAPVVAAPPREKPSVERPLHRLFCVEYARMRTGLAVFGDAREWWERARNLYARLSRPAEEAVMVFASSKRLKLGHVAVVTEIVSPREVIVDQANWQNHGEIDHATPVLDVSRNNDWSLVRVWDIPSGSFGGRTYAISGFIAKGLTRQARND